MFLPSAGYAILPSDRYAADGAIGAKIILTQPWCDLWLMVPPLPCQLIPPVAATRQGQGRGDCAAAGLHRGD
jgi:hypothetical protein